MAKRSRRGHGSQAKLQELVVVAFTGDTDQAKDYEAVLKNNEIPVVVRESENDSDGTTQIAVMVPEEFADEAHVIIESQDAYDDFYDLAVEDDESDFGADILDDEF